MEVLSVTRMSSKAIYRSDLVRIFWEVRHATSCSWHSGVQCELNHVGGVNRPVGCLRIGDPKSINHIDAPLIYERALCMNLRSRDFTIETVAL